MYASQRENLQKNVKGKRSVDENRKAQKNKKKIKIKQQIFWQQVNKHITTNTLKRIRKITELYGLEKAKLSIVKAKIKQIGFRA